MVSEKGPSPAKSSGDPLSIATKPILLTPERITAFRKSITLEHDWGVPATLATLFRESEFRWLDRMGVDLRHLLHTEQQYEYVSPLVPGEKIAGETTLKRKRERKGLLLVTLETRIRSASNVRVIATTHFVVRPPGNTEGT